MIKLKQVIYIVSALSLLSLFGCAPRITKSYVNKNNNQVMEKININALLRAKNKETKNKIIKIDTIFNAKLNRVQTMGYSEYDKRTKEEISITWTLNGNVSHKYTANYEKREYLEFYENGNLMSKQIDTIIHIYPDDRYLQFTIGTRYEYDEEGNITTAIDFDSKYTFGLENLYKLLKTRYGITVCEAGIIQYKEYNGDDYYWEVIYRDKDNFLTRLLVHGITGDITEKGHFTIIE